MNPTIKTNIHEVHCFLDHISHTRALAATSLRVYDNGARRLARWADLRRLWDVETKTPTYPEYLASDDLSAAYMRKMCQFARMFYSWARSKWPSYAHITPEWINSLRPASGDQVVRERRVYRLSEVRSLLNVHTRTLTEERTRAAAAFLFLSGMRVGAFASMPVIAVDLTKGTGAVRQWPALGVRTKNGKAANTWLLDVPDLRAAVLAWDTKVRAAVPDGPWFAKIDRRGRGFLDNQVPGEYRPEGFRKQLHKLCDRAGVAYQGVHAFRHGHAMYAMTMCKDMGDVKAVSQNLMHNSVVTTDSIYGVLTSDIVGARIAALHPSENKDAIALLERLLDMLKSQAGAVAPQ